ERVTNRRSLRHNAVSRRVPTPSERPACRRARKTRHESTFSPAQPTFVTRPRLSALYRVPRTRHECAFRKVCGVDSGNSAVSRRNLFAAGELVDGDVLEPYGRAVEA
ncbi:MAG: hypothetical protein OZ928_20230, partial [Polyangiaceae bacterium]|nr:hypothetical protein [Polyangiaceae bacterium]